MAWHLHIILTMCGMLPVSLQHINWPHTAMMIILDQGSNAANQLVMMIRSTMSMMITVD